MLGSYKDDEMYSMSIRFEICNEDSGVTCRTDLEEFLQSNIFRFPIETSYFDPVGEDSEMFLSVI